MYWHYSADATSGLMTNGTVKQDLHCYAHIKPFHCVSMCSLYLCFIGVCVVMWPVHAPSTCHAGQADLAATPLECRTILCPTPLSMYN
jgi:hypothetical protein